MKKTALWLAAIVGLQVAWIGVTAATKEAQLARGTDVLLETVPVDPRDLLRGDYVALRYKISDLPDALFTAVLPRAQAGSLESELAGRKVYVVLEPHGQFYEAVAASLEPSKVAPGQVLIRGTVVPDRWRWHTNSIHVNYEIERYYVPEGTGNPRGKVTVKAAVASDGAVLIKEVFIDGKPYAEAMRGQKR